MAQFGVRFGLAGVSLLVAGCTAMAQEAQPAAQGAYSCSGFVGCLLSPKSESRPAPVQAAAEPPLPATDAPEPGAVTKTAAPRKPVKTIPPIVIAADDAEAARLAALAKTLPKSRIRIVKPDAGRSADFEVSASLDASQSRQRARLFTEQLHIVAGPAIASPADLEGKVVSFGLEGANRDAARKAFATLGIAVKETPLDLDNALDGLATGDIQAVVMLAPRPVARFARLRADGLHLVSWPEGTSVPEGASVGTIPASAYPGLIKPGESVRAMGVEAVLNSVGKGAHTPAAAAFLVAMSQHSAALSKRGFDLIKADVEARAGRRVASAERR